MCVLPQQSQRASQQTALSQPTAVQRAVWRRPLLWLQASAGQHWRLRPDDVAHLGLRQHNRRSRVDGENKTVMQLEFLRQRRLQCTGGVPSICHIWTMQRTAETGASQTTNAVPSSRCRLRQPPGSRGHLYLLLLPHGALTTGGARFVESDQRAAGGGGASASGAASHGICACRCCTSSFAAL